MRERALAVLRSYAQAASPRSGFGGCLLALLLWGALAIPAYALRGPMTLSMALVVPVALTVGRHLARQFRSYRARTMPGYTAPHVAVGGAVVMAGALLAVLAISAFFPQFNHGAVLGAVWLCANLALLAGYSMFPAEIGTAVLALILMGLWLLDWRYAIDYAAWPALGLNAVLTGGFFHSLFRHKDERPMVQFSINEPPPQMASGSLAERSQRWCDAVLDPSLFRFGPDLFSRLKHLALCISLPFPLAKTTIGMAIFWLVLTAIFPRMALARHSSWTILYFALMSITMTGAPGLARKRLQWLSTFPLRRRQMVAMYGCALFGLTVRAWLVFAFPGYLVLWARSALAGAGNSAPVLALLVGFTFLPAAVGLVTLLQSLGRSLGWTMLPIMAIIPLFAILGVASDVLGADLTYAPVAVGLLGLLLSWASYVRWCRVEFD